ncbi:hypothetical protein AAVH_07262 [Aphelenchoides avenae]|nr:hypothetical protein AAVH_07262 [Aphelenchus avenae]
MVGREACRDLTELELQTHYSLKNRAYVLNKECGLYKYHYVDLDIITLRDPKPLRKRAQKVSEE